MTTWIDMHLDLAYLAQNGRDLTEAEVTDGGCVTFPALRAAGVHTVCGTIYTEPVASEAEVSGAWQYSRDDADAAHAAGVAQLDIYREWESRGEIAIVRSADDLTSDREDAIRVVLLMEGADPIRTPEEVSWWRAQGLRIVGLTWAVGTRYAGGNYAGGSYGPRGHGPLTDAGRDLVDALVDAGIGLDASHLCDESFDDLMSRADECVHILATHSNARALHGNDDQRHLTDDQIKAIVSRGGVIGLNLYRNFLRTDRPATAADAADHVEHVCSIVGHRGHVCLGSDMDGGFGVEGLPVDVQHPAALTAITDELSTRGWLRADIDGFTLANALNQLRKLV